MYASKINHMGTDMTVVNAARVSFSKQKPENSELDERDKKLISYLAKHGHWTPFAHTSITFEMCVPMFVQRQIDKHQAGFVTNEISRRYVDERPEYFETFRFRKRPDKSIKQGSGEEFSLEEDEKLYDIYLHAMKESMSVYEALLAEGVAPEQARMVLPMSTYTTTWKTGNLYGWANFYNKRIESNAQREVQDVAKIVGHIIEDLFPISWKALTNG